MEIIMRFIGALFLCMALTLIACENDSGSDDKKDTSDTNSCEPGSTFNADDGCNTCTCPESGKKSEAACTEIDCGQSMNGCENIPCGGTCVTIADCPGVCNAESTCVCEGGELGCPYNPCAGKSCGDTCSMCDPADKVCTETAEEKACNEDGKCGSGGAVICDDPDACEPGTTFNSDDGCNTCTCPESGKISEAACTEKACPPSDQCDGLACGSKCTLVVACDAVCNLKGECVCDIGEVDECEDPDACEPGTTFAAGDGCNTCSCPESGKKSEAACTALGCPPYEPCQGKKCGDTCSMCDPADKVCTETAE
ncbi:MAG TPA: hypothetical protein EYN66_14780, partial [Myxococcales bacterium]|nr:hypothetical protein [Myxococcales bacterium]